MIQNLDWQNIEFKNFDNNSYYYRKQPDYTINKNKNFFVLNFENKKYKNQQKLIKLLSNDIVLHYNNGINYIYDLYPSLKYILPQLRLDFPRESCTINGEKVKNVNNLLDYIEYNIHNTYEQKVILSSCTQAIMALPLLAINAYFDLEKYVLGEVNSDIDKSMYVDLQIAYESWSVHIQKPLRIFDQYDTLYCVLIDIDIDKGGVLISIKPFL